MADTPSDDDRPPANNSGGTTALFGAAAHAYVSAGWPSVLPLPHAEKTPPPGGYTGRNGAWPTRAQVEEWADQFPDGNLALRLPPDVIGVDVDAYGDKPGRQTLADLEAELGALPPTIISTSRSDGISGIRLYRTPQRPAWHDPGPGIEIIHSGWRYIVASPSIHDKTGDHYRWVRQDTGELVNGAPVPAGLPELPTAWAERLSSDAQLDKADVDATVIDQWIQSQPTGMPCTATRNALREFHSDLHSGAARHDAMLDATGRLVRALERGHQGGQVALNEARHAFLSAVTTDGSRSLTQAENEWRRAIEGAYQLVAATPTPEHDRGCRCGGHDLPGVTTLDVDTAAAARDEHPTEEATELARQIDEAYPPLDWEALWDSGIDEVDWIVEGIVETGRAGALFAPAKSGKSLFLLELSACVATGQTFAGQDIPEPRTVLYVDREMSPADVIDRLKTLGFHWTELDRLVYLSLPSLPPLDRPEGGEHLHAIAARHDAALVVLDTASRVVEGPENDSDTYRDYYTHTGQRLKKAGIAVWRLDHAGKDLTRGQRGASAKNDDVDAVWKIIPRGNGRMSFKMEMRRTLHGIEELYLTRNDNGRLQTLKKEDGDTTDSDDLVELEEIIAALDAGDIPEDWGRRKVRSSAVGQAISCRNELLDAAIKMRRDRAHRPPEATVLDIGGPVPDPVPEENGGDRSGDRSGGAA